MKVSTACFAASGISTMTGAIMYSVPGWLLCDLTHNIVGLVNGVLHGATAAQIEEQVAKKVLVCTLNFAGNGALAGLAISIVPITLGLIVHNCYKR
jgi:hypothetical protein